MAKVNSDPDIVQLTQGIGGNFVVFAGNSEFRLPESYGVANEVPFLPPLPPRSLFKFVPSLRRPMGLGGPVLHCISKYGEYGVRMQEWLFTKKSLSEVFIGADKGVPVEWLRTSVKGKIAIMFSWPGYGNLSEWTLEVNLLQKQPSGRIDMIMQGELISLVVQRFHLFCTAITIQADEDYRGSHPLGWDPHLASTSDEWRLDGCFGMNFSHVNLVSIRHVMGSIFEAHFAVLQSDIVKKYNL